MGRRAEPAARGDPCQLRSSAWEIQNEDMGHGLPWSKVDFNVIEPLETVTLTFMDASGNISLDTIGFISVYK